MKTVALVGALDTKGEEFRYLKERIEKAGAKAFVVNTGILGEPAFKPDIPADEVIRAAGEKLEDLRKEKSRSKSNEAAGRGAKLIVKKLYDEKKIDGILMMGGGQGTLIGMGVMNVLPLGFPKVLISTLQMAATGYGGSPCINDTFYMRSLVDVTGFNTVMRLQMNNAVAAIIGLVNAPIAQERFEEKKRIALSMLGITTPCITRVQELLEKKGYEVFVFHANGDGGYQMEQMVANGFFYAMGDITLAEIIPQFIPGGTGYSGPERMLAAGRAGIPRLIVPGAMDIVNYPGGIVPEQYKDRVFHMHSPELKVMRTSIEENRMLGKVIAERVNQGKGKVIVAFPLRGLSANDIEGYYFYDPEANAILFETIKANLRSDIPVYEFDYHINDKEFAEHITDLMLKELL